MNRPSSDTARSNAAVSAFPPLSPKVSILMAVYNAEPFIDKAILSLQGQTMPHWQLICVDDASTDGSWQRLQQYAQTDPRITLLHKQKNEGQAIARNEALQHAEGELVTMLDADDWLSADCLQKAIEAFTDQTDTVVLRLMEWYPEGEDGERGREVPYPTRYALSDVISGHDAFVASLDWQLHGLYVVRRSLHQRYPYDTSCRLFSDDNTTRLHYLHSREVRFCAGTYCYRKHAQSCTNAITADRFLYMSANLSMLNTLRREGVSPDVIAFYEQHRWLNYIGQIWLYVQHRDKLTEAERKQIRDRFRFIYATFHGNPVPPKFGYTHFRSYRLFRWQEHLYFFLRRLKEGIHRDAR